VAVNLKRDAKDVNIDAGEYQPLLKNLQANILRPHGRKNVRHIFIAFTAGPAAARNWLKASAPKITTARQQYDQIKARETNPGLDGGTVFGLLLSAAGYRALELNPEALDSESFERGMKDPTGGQDPASSTWEAPFRKEIHAMVAVADNSFSKANSAAQAVANSLAGVGQVLATQEGTVLRRPTSEGKFEPVEHFGYFDGISNPIFTARDLAAEKKDIKIGAEWDPTARLDLVLRDDPFTNVEDACGSFLVYRKLHQDVGLFEKRVKELAGKIPMSEDLTGAMLVGRFRDGTPVVAQKAETADFSVTNDFNYNGDDAGFKCPAHAHIRKVNPRERIPLSEVLGDGRKRRIVRRGIPYGKPVPGLVEESIPSDPNRSADRGLLFLCFQANIKKQFEFIQRTWVDNPGFPNGTLPGSKNTGYDPLIGQKTDEGQRWPKKWGDKNAGRDRISFKSAVTLKGGEYFFAPSIAFLQSLSG
jgi:Dyp-type peroxidase family